MSNGVFITRRTFGAVTMQGNDKRNILWQKGKLFEHDPLIFFVP